MGTAKFRGWISWVFSDLPNQSKVEGLAQNDKSVQNHNGAIPVDTTCPSKKIKVEYTCSFCWVVSLAAGQGAWITLP
jgi:hypothetical protein